MDIKTYRLILLGTYGAFCGAMLYVYNKGMKERTRQSELQFAVKLGYEAGKEVGRIKAQEA